MNDKQGVCLATSVWIAGIGTFEIRYYADSAYYDETSKDKPSYNDLLENKQFVVKKIIDALNRIYLAYEEEEKNES